MKFSILQIAVVVGSAFAQSGLDDLPLCARTCVGQFTSGSNIGDCSSFNVACICSSQSFLSGIACCLAGACSIQDQQSAVSFALGFCRIAGVTNLPTAVTCASTSSRTAAPTPVGFGNGSTPARSTSSTTPAATLGNHLQASPTPTTPQNVGAHNMAGVGAGLVGGVLAFVGYLL